MRVRRCTGYRTGTGSPPCFNSLFSFLPHLLLCTACTVSFTTRTSSGRSHGTRRDGMPPPLSKALSPSTQLFRAFCRSLRVTRIDAKISPTCPICSSRNNKLWPEQTLLYSSVQLSHEHVCGRQAHAAHPSRSSTADRARNRAARVLTSFTPRRSIGCKRARTVPLAKAASCSRAQRKVSSRCSSSSTLHCSPPTSWRLLSFLCKAEDPPPPAPCFSLVLRDPRNGVVSARASKLGVCVRSPLFFAFNQRAADNENYAPGEPCLRSRLLVAGLGGEWKRGALERCRVRG